jgi:hypothetical protein
MDSMMLKASRRWPMSGIVGAAQPPLPLDVVQGLLAALDSTPVVLDLEPAVLCDVAEVGGDGFHAPPSPGDFDHDLRRPPNGGLDAVPDDVARLVPSLDGACAP